MLSPPLNIIRGSEKPHFEGCQNAHFLIIYSAPKGGLSRGYPRIPTDTQRIPPKSTADTPRIPFEISPKSNPWRPTGELHGLFWKPFRALLQVSARKSITWRTDQCAKYMLFRVDIWPKLCSCRMMGAQNGCQSSTFHPSVSLLDRAADPRSS